MLKRNQLTVFQKISRMVITTPIIEIVGKKCLKKEKTYATSQQLTGMQHLSSAILYLLFTQQSQRCIVINFIW